MENLKEKIENLKYRINELEELNEPGTESFIDELQRELDGLRERFL